MHSSIHILLVLACLLLLTGVHAELTVRVIDAGQGNAQLFQSGGYAMLVDAGPESASDRIISALNDAGVNWLDYLVISGPGEEHTGAMGTVLEAVPVGMYIDGEYSHGDEAVTYLLQSNQITILNKTHGVSLPFGDASISFITAPGQDEKGRTALKVTDGSVSWVIPGDDTTIVTPATALILPDHGGVGSADHIREINPHLVVITGKKSGTQASPDPAVLKILDEADIQVYRTDQKGTLQFHSDGSTITEQTADSEAESQVNQAVSPGYEGGIDWEAMGKRFSQEDKDILKGFINGSIPFDQINWEQFGDKFTAAELHQMKQYGMSLLSSLPFNLSSIEEKFMTENLTTLIPSGMMGKTGFSTFNLSDIPGYKNVAG
jgi:competence protein ComEC